MPSVFNPWAEWTEAYDIGPDAPAIRRDNLRRYLEHRLGSAKYILVAEAAGYKGARFSGITMTDERLLLGHRNTDRIKPTMAFDGDKKRTSRHGFAGRTGSAESTSCVMYNFMADYGVDPHEVVMWNSFPFHPYKPNQPMSNRTPAQAEIDACNEIHRIFFSLFPGCQVIAVGQKASTLLKSMGIQHQAVRHPANGGVPDFRLQTAAAMKVKLTPLSLSLFGDEY